MVWWLLFGLPVDWFGWAICWLSIWLLVVTSACWLSISIDYFFVGRWCLLFFVGWLVIYLFGLLVGQLMVVDWHGWLLLTWLGLTKGNTEDEVGMLEGDVGGVSVPVVEELLRLMEGDTEGTVGLL